MAFAMCNKQTFHSMHVKSTRCLTDGKKKTFFPTNTVRSTKIILLLVSDKQCSLCLSVSLFWILFTCISIPRLLYLKVNSIPPRLNTIQAVGEIQFLLKGT